MLNHAPLNRPHDVLHVHLHPFITFSLLIVINLTWALSRDSTVKFVAEWEIRRTPPVKNCKH
ncbi:hypothetical protein BDI4_2270002 [Burkholderia diffusa]|nr:hypothetical protein BDI4_2270002 [Burkholderia diffusa]